MQHQMMATSGYQPSIPSTVNAEASSKGMMNLANSNIAGSQSRIKVTLTQEGQKMNLDEDNEEHAESPGLINQQPRPTLNQQRQFAMGHDGRPSHDSTPNPPIQEMANME